MHFSQKLLKDFVLSRLTEPESSKISGHLTECEFCSEFCDNYRLYIQATDETAAIEIPAAAMDLAERLYAEAFQGKIIDFKSPVDCIESPLSVAADGSDQLRTDVINLGTFYSENPDLVLRIMRDKAGGVDYLQLTGKNPELTSHVLVQLPEMNMEFVTDDRGKAILTNLPESAVTGLKWQVRMPDASFSLKPLKYDPNAVEYTQEIVLETDRHDKIKITLQGMTEGKQINIRILELDGKSDFDAVKIVVSQKENISSKTTSDKDTHAFNLDNSEAEIKIRLFS